MLRTLGSSQPTRCLRGVIAALLVAAAVMVPMVATPVTAVGDGPTIQAGPDVVSGFIGASVRITIRVDGVPPGKYRIAYEVAGGPAETEPSSGFSPGSPEGGCTVQANAIPSSCFVDIPMVTGEPPGESLVFFWLDSNARYDPTTGDYIEGSGDDVEELDRAEGRYAGPSDCDALQDRSPSCLSGTPRPGNSLVEPDITDVVSITWTTSAGLLDCEPLRDKVDSDTVAVAEAASGWFDCSVTSADGKFGIPNIYVDAENYSDGDPSTTSWENNGANDPDGGPPSIEDQSASTADYDNICLTGPDGHCIVEIPGTPKSQLGPAAICFWIDGIKDYQPKPTVDNPDTPEDETEEETRRIPDSQFKPNGESDERHNGGLCDRNGEVPLKVNPDEKDWRTEKVLVRWESPSFIKGGLDVQPDNQVLKPGQDGRLVAAAYDQFGGLVANVVVRFDVFGAGKSQWKTSSRLDEEESRPHCVTDATGQCSIFFQSPANGGTDYFCAWTQRLYREPAPRGDERPDYNETGGPRLMGGGTTSTCGPNPAGASSDFEQKRLEDQKEDLFDETANDGTPSPVYDAWDVTRIEWSAPPPPTTTTIVEQKFAPTGVGYWLVADDGGVFAFGEAGFYGSTGDIKLNKPIVTAAATPSGQGYWLVASDGGVFAFGDAGFYGSTGDIKLNKPIVGMTPTKSGKGYWLVASDGGIFAFGDAAFHGSTGDIKLNKPIIGMAAPPSGDGYWLLAEDGGIFTFGTVGYYGSAGGEALAAPMAAMASTPTGEGYWLVGSDGTMFTFGDASYFGSPYEDGTVLNKPIVGMAAAPSGDGYWLVGSDGGMFAYGDAAFFGSTGNMQLNRPILGMAVAVQVRPVPAS